MGNRIQVFKLGVSLELDYNIFQMSLFGNHTAKLLTSLALILGLAWYLFSQKGISTGDIFLLLRNFDLRTLSLCAFLVGLQNFLMAARIWLLFPKGQRVPLGSTVHTVFYGQSINTFLPARAGDVLKAVMFSKLGSSTVSTAAGVIVADKITDIFALLLLILSSRAYLFLSPPTTLPVSFGTVVIVVFFILAVGFLFRNFLALRFGHFFGWWQGFKHGLLAIFNWKRIFLALIIGIVAWSCEAIALLLLCKAQTFPITFSQSVFLLALLNLAIAVPLSLANLGPFEAALVFGMGQLGASAAMSLAVATTHHSLQMGILVLLTGFFLLIRSLRNFSSSPEKEFLVQDSDKRKAIDYFERASSDYHETVSKGILVHFRNRERSKVLELLSLDQPNLSVIDVGCGAGFYSFTAKKLGLSVHAVDMSPGMLKKLEGLVDKVSNWDIETMPTDLKYDRVVCAGVLDFVQKPEVAFANLCKLVNENGRLVILCPRKGLGGLFYRCEKYFFGIRVNLFTKDWLSKQAAEHGLKLTKVFYPLPTNMALLFSKR